MATWAVSARSGVASDEAHDDHQEEDESDDPENLHPSGCPLAGWGHGTGIGAASGAGVGHADHLSPWLSGSSAGEASTLPSLRDNMVSVLRTCRG